MVLNKSYVPSEVSDSSFSMFMYMPKKDKNDTNSFGSINKSSRDEEASKSDINSYDYDSSSNKQRFKK